MLIDEQFRKCAAYLLADVPNDKTNALERTPIATTFLVSTPVAPTVEAWVVYAVTARHVIEMSRRYGTLWLRLNKKEGGHEDFPADQDLWAENGQTDLSVILLSVDLSQFDVLAIPESMFASDAFMKTHPLGVGDDLFFAGLFSEHAGQDRSQPIVRFGNIAMMPHEKITVTIGEGDPPPTQEIEAYLAEAHSWGGHSGSPAFVYFPPHRFMGSVRLDQGAMPKLLGMVQGHYEIPRRIRFLGDILGSGRVDLNTGIAAIVPAQKILDTLNTDNFVDDRAARHAIWKTRQPPTAAD